MAEVDGIDMFIVFADVMGDGSDGGARSDIGSIISSPFTSSPSVYVGSRPSSAPALTMSRSTPVPPPSRSARTSGRSSQEVRKVNALHMLTLFDCPNLCLTGQLRPQTSSSAHGAICTN
jgi:hypothetical protein